MEVSASEFARMAGVSPMAVSKKIKNGTLIRNSGRKLDTDNPVNRAYMERKQSAMKEKLSLREMETAVANENNASAQLSSDASMNGASCGNAVFLDALQSRSGDKDFFLDGDRRNVNANQQAAVGAAGAMLNMTIRQLIMRHGTLDNVEKYSKILRDLSAADEREQKLQERRLMQIPKDFVTQRMFGYIDTLMRQLLDVPESICDALIAMVVADGEGARSGVIHLLSDNLTKCIAGAKEHIASELNSLRGKYEMLEKNDDALGDMVEQVLQDGR